MGGGGISVKQIALRLIFSSRAQSTIIYLSPLAVVSNTDNPCVSVIVTERVKLYEINHHKAEPQHEMHIQILANVSALPFNF